MPRVPRLLLLFLALTGLLRCAPVQEEPAIFGALGEPLPTATEEERATFERGRQVALRRFTPAEGLGPHFNVVSCGACHERPVLGGGAGRYRNFLLTALRLSNGAYVPRGVNGVQPQFDLATVRRPTSPGANAHATRHAIPFFGAGLLLELPDASILAHVDASDRDGDGVSGRPNFDRGVLSRFGRKAQNASLESFIRGPLFNHAGVTTSPLSEERRAALPRARSGGAAHAQAEGGLHGASAVVRQAQVGAPDAALTDEDGVPDPELSEQELFDLLSFVLLTAAPRPDALTAEAEAGRDLFAQVRCTACHVPALEGPRGRVPAYSDLLLHDMGPDLADGVTMGEATGSEFRTQPLWGVTAVGPYLHDGRAGTLEQAILLHGGEARASREAFAALAPSDRARVLTFLESLGSGAQRSPGLLPPDAPLPQVGEHGGPDRPLDGPERQRFEEGRRLFDRDFGLGEGVGPRFNGDSCRACHFDPVPGGAGPLDVDVIRQGVRGEAGVEAVAGGTLVHRHGALDARPPLAPEADVLERRQTPHLFGLGLLERILEASLLARADPEDADGDGVSGRPHRLADGRLGRFGWKANVPTVREFVRDALSNELGLTLPTEPGHSFGAGADADGVADPETDLAAVDTLEFFLSRLGPPPRTRSAPAREDAGELLFARVGCDRCHVPMLKTEGGEPVPLYGDLLLHDVTLGAREGVPEGAAGGRELRTPPLWGLATSAPYLHDGAAATVEEAVALHGGEAERARLAFEQLSGEERGALLAFLESL